MKKKLLLTLLSGSFLISNSYGIAKWGIDLTNKRFNTDFGVKAGGNFQQINAYPFTPAFNPGYIAGAYIEHRWNVLGLKLEATVSSAKYVTEFAAARKYYVLDKVTTTDTVSKADLSTMSINIPLMGEIRASERFTFLLGAQYSMVLSVKDNNGAYTKIHKPEDVFKKTSFAAITGFEVGFAKKFRFGATYTMGVSDINNSQIKGIDGKWITTGAQAYLTYRIRRWSKHPMPGL
ncbi:MAG: outer membrane beta-barrel protein [Taibaiella sp.]|nr:outer membrane beta-barrel protein [Taibaiella sp.]